MSGQNFVFPPPPPPPPQAASPAYPSYAQPAYPQHSGYGGRGNRGDRGPRPRGRGENHRGPRGGGYRAHGQGSAGGYGGYSPRDAAHYIGQQNGGYSPRTNGGGRSSYPLPEYPPVQQPQYAPPQHNGYSYHSPPPYSPAVVNPHPHQPPYVTNRSIVDPRYDDPPHHTPYGYDPRPQNDPYRSHDSHRPGPPQHRPPNKHNQPVLMGPPIRMGFDSQPPADFRQAPPPIQPPFQHPVSNGASPYHHDHHNDHHYDQRYERRYENRAPYRQDSPGGFHANHHNSPNPFPGNRGRGQKRGHSDAIGKPRTSNPRTPAAPAVPSFGNPLPVKPPVPQENGRKPRKKKRRTNQLGLTPKAEEHESSSEEEDADEESKLAATVGAAGSKQAQLQFTYKGQTATLQSASDIAAWIAERKKRYPTKARAEEIAMQKRQLQEIQKAANEARKEKQEQRKAEIKDKQKLVELNEATQKAKLKAEKLRKQLRKEEKRIARAEAEAAKAKNKASAVANSNTVSTQNNESLKRKREGSVASTVSGTANGLDEVKVEVKIEPSDSSNIIGDSVVQDGVARSEVPNQNQEQTAAPAVPSQSTTEALPDSIQATEALSALTADLILPAETPAPVPETANGPTLPEDSHISADTDNDDSMSMSNSSSDISLSSSSSSSSDDDDNDISSHGCSSDDNDAPDEAPSKRSGPIRVPPPKREKPNHSICREFLRRGHCRRGETCNFLHELPERGRKSAGRVKERGGKEGKGGEGGKRIGLYQRMVEQEREREDNHVVQAIVYLGQQGLLNEPEANGAMGEGSIEE